MDLQQMRYVVAVAETRNFTRAAERCSVVQSSLSHRIAGLERELGVKLFARSSRRVELTSAGAAFLVGARECLAAADRAVADAAAATGVVRGRLAVGVIVTTAAVDVPELLQRYRAQHPDVHVLLRSGRSDELVAAIRNGELDIAFLGLPEGERPPGVETVVLDHDEHVLVVPAGHRLAGVSQVTLREIAEETYVDFVAGTPARAQSDQAFAAAGLVRDVAYEAGVVELITRLITRGLGIALLPSAFIRPLAADDPELALVPVVDGPHRIEYLAWSRFNPSPATRAMLDVLGVRPPSTVS
ncbi:LysR family transcriptional regulator [Streptomyces avermitilis]|uniref:LysR family transcriptional regulator n=1 Tax=Streptomyces avermitilis TaxID=33903 RepID=A0A4D4MRY6_STRAX|nr:LysR family transcriptional regulator [Streptomyces avermitilis]MYT00374.1 LysR family transcriptional regulator [Streptomyces sp. SID5469]KUN52487.1 LysR family transcriptional regulator [Streptomyces avermitilis]OOV31451.1 LysR family transcriptional regulator [Streptomyces avermitilis]BBJ52855.1 LysR family transcriptional regulator [Streptomyces avermitilis]GDY64879.1 LysR family transcriptional regulator [Streptomyces avermitilis]